MSFVETLPSVAQGQACRFQAVALEGSAPEVEGYSAARLVPSSEPFSDVCPRFPGRSFVLVAGRQLSGTLTGLSMSSLIRRLR